MSLPDRPGTGPTSDVPVVIQVISGIGGVLLLVGIVLLGYSYLDSGSWGTFGDRPARVMLLGIFTIIGAALSYAVKKSGPQ